MALREACSHVDLLGDSSANVELVSSIDALTTAGRSTKAGGSSHFLAVAQALLFYAAGELDRSHNLVLPLSWPAATPFGGRPIPGSAAAQDATYVHALLHRQEGEFVGQEGGGMVGWDNAAFWFSQVGRHPLYPAVLEGAARLAKGNRAAKAHVLRHGKGWKPRLFLELCQETQGTDSKLAQFCRAVMNLEWRLLLDHVLAKV